MGICSQCRDLCCYLNDIHHDGRSFLERYLSSDYELKEIICNPEDEIDSSLRFVNK